MDRYQHIITAAYNGHTHNDELAIIFNDNSKPVSVNFISGSLTTYSYLNPSYKIFQLNNVGQPIDYDVFFLDLNKDNELARKNNAEIHEPVWMHEFSAKYSYRMNNLSISAWEDFLERANNDLDTSYTYSEHYHRHSLNFSVVLPLEIENVKKLVKSIKISSPFFNKQNL